MSESMQQELEDLLEKLDAIPVIKQVKREQVADRIKTNLVDASDKVNRSNDGLIAQLRIECRTEKPGIFIKSTYFST
ncbi:MAG TPA: hypothetical protein VNW04_03305 [Puia sp.]|jgi:hypothetical protein|nr:hypothetical protein [Puia sp.]